MNTWTQTAPQNEASSTALAAQNKPWWRYGLVWLVVGGPLLVVIAGIFTVVIAVRGADEVLTVAPPAHAAQAPAGMARNHAATPDKDVPLLQHKKP